MLGSKSKYFQQSAKVLKQRRKDVYTILYLKGYSFNQITIYLRAFDFFCESPNSFDGATIVKDMQDVPLLDLDAMLHDYHYLTFSVASNFKTKWKADWLFAKQMEKKGKGLYTAYSRFIALTIVGIGFVPYSYLKRGKISIKQNFLFNQEYKLLMS